MPFFDAFTIGQPGPALWPYEELEEQLLGLAWAWYKPETLLANPDGADVAQWDDSTGNGRHISNATVAEQPTMQAGGIRGYPSLAFDGTNNQSLSRGGSPATEITVFLVGQILTAGGTLPKDTVIFSPSGTFNPGLLYTMRSSAIDEYKWNRVAFEQDVVNTTPFIAFFKADDNLLGTLSISDVGAGSVSGIGTGLPGTAIKLGGAGTDRPGDTFQSWRVSEIIIFSSLLPNPLSVRIASYLSRKYQLTQPLIL